MVSLVATERIRVRVQPCGRSYRPGPAGAGRYQASRSHVLHGLASTGLVGSLYRKKRTDNLFLHAVVPTGRARWPR